MMMNSIWQSDLSTEEDIDMTNMIDIMTLLVALLMICLPSFTLLSSDLEKLPGDRATAELKSQIRVEFSADDKFFWDEQAVSWEELKSKCKAIADQEEVFEILLIGHKNASNGCSQRVRHLFSRSGLKAKELTHCSEE